MPIGRFFRRRPPEEEAARALYETVVIQARRPEFYMAGGVADNVDGRFDMVALHAWLTLARLRSEGAKAQALSQAFYDLMFADMDQNLREMGVGDLGVGKRVMKMAEALNGRVAAYDQGLADSGDALADALRRNLYRKSAPSDGQVASMAAHVRRQSAHLAGQPAEGLLAGRIDFAPPEEFAH
ncbi:MAG: ubiquinol-cytochrome C chaperone family protein [Alphaproteobacteria bacterium]|nr:ubiquinol-cytochrome C chaperone family protein [Alphaproteobacteria bacterium]